MADYSQYKLGDGYLGKHGWYISYEAFIDACGLVANEVETARQGQASLSASIDLRVPKSGLTAHFSAQNYRINTLANPVNPQDAVNLQTVQSLISGGGTPANIGITSLNKGTATAMQLIRVNSGGTAIEGVTFKFSDLNVGTGLENEILKVENGAIVSTNNLVDRLFWSNT